ncbi:MAG: type I glutamate--ammonia ligase [Acidimicrobiia bacterium]|nr:type I glutamate--ammonia ligase [Acidimicrobiia bacterium]
MDEKSPAEVLAEVEEHGVQIVDFRFCDVPGVMQHVSIPASKLTESQFEDGHPFDGSSVRGFQEIQESDMILVPDPNTSYLDPFRQHRTLVIHCFVGDPVTGESYSRDPRHVAQKAQEHLFSTGIADSAYFGPEPEFFVFDDVRFETTANSSWYQVDSIEGQWNTGTDEAPNLGYKPRTKQGYFPVPPMDHYQDLRSAMMLNLHEVGIDTELHHHEVASGGQGEIGIRFDTLLAMADKLMTFKYVLKQTAWAAGKSLTFMPKPVFEDNGSGMHTHQSLWKGGEPLFFDETGYAGLSDIARWYIGGLLHHAHAVIAFTNPTTNSFKRLVPGYEAPVNLVYSQRNRSASCRIPLASKSPRAKRVEFRCPDSTSNPYLGFSAMLLAGLDGIQNRIEPPAPMDKDLYDLPPEELADVPQVPASLEEALAALEADQDFLKAGGVFTDDLIDTWIAYKRRHEVDALRLRPHPYEFSLYYDI